jgi:peptidoglycan hydrolase-like protein with peptidoglycan-binding domain
MLERQTARSSASAAPATTSSASRATTTGPTAPPMLDAPASAEADLWGHGAAETAARTESGRVSSASARTSSGMGTATLRLGAQGSTVRALQTALNRYGATLRVDGDFGNATHRAVVAFQRANPPLTQDGVVGPITRGVLQGGRARSVTGAPASAAPTTGAPAAGPAAGSGLGTATLRQGARGEAVKALQRLLNTHGARLGVDGDFGAVTHRAVVAFQAANGLTQDGVVGAITRGVLSSGTARSVSAGPSAAPATPAGAAAPPNVLSALGWARSQVNAPYYGGSSPFRDGARPGDGKTYQMTGQSAYVSQLGVIGYDCSGFVTAVMRQAGVELGPQSSGNLRRSLPAVNKSALLPGDLLVKDGHVAIYLGEGQMIESIPKGVSISSATKYISDAAYEGRRPW